MTKTQPTDCSHHLSSCLSIDLEVDLETNKIFALAAIRSDSERKVCLSRRSVGSNIRELDALAKDVEFLVGHNILDFDLHYLRELAPSLTCLNKPIVDTLRLGPLAFPRNSYHHLVKHYKEPNLIRFQKNDPELDARICLDVLKEQARKFRSCSTQVLCAWHWLTTLDDPSGGFSLLFRKIRAARRPNKQEAHQAIQQIVGDRACNEQLTRLLDSVRDIAWPLAYAISWISVSGSNSVVPPWVLLRFPKTMYLLRQLRDTRCNDSRCKWCSTRHNARAELKTWFGFDNFRLEPKTHENRSMQQEVVERNMARKHVLGILPTGTGKSLCYQVPALSRYDKLGSLTVVISPLVALMADQLTSLTKRNITSCVAINGLLTLPERAEALNKVRLGDASIVLISPEQLRNLRVQSALLQREIGGWVIDEAHCLSSWGHDFRPDYRYVTRFIRERSGNQEIPPILCLTATAKPDVVAEIQEHFRDRLGVDLEILNGGAQRSNLDFEVIPTSGEHKEAHIHSILTEYLPEGEAGGAIVYCATRSRTEKVADFLQKKGLAANYFHAGLESEQKKEVQGRFIGGELTVIVATNAFGMGIDKPDVRLVLHADIPGSLENYMQEAGRAGRDTKPARCVLMYSPDDVEKQFSLSAATRLTQKEIQGIWKALRNIDRKGGAKRTVVATTGEILLRDDDQDFERDHLTEDTKVGTAVLWLEESKLIRRDANETRVFPSSLRVATKYQAWQILKNREIPFETRESLLKIVELLLNSNNDDGISTDELMDATGLKPEATRQAMYELDNLGIVSNDTTLTAFVHRGVQNSSNVRFENAVEIEMAVIECLQESAPDMDVGDSHILYLRQLSQDLRGRGIENPLPEIIWRIVDSISNDGKTDGENPSWFVRRIDPDHVRITLQRNWQTLQEVSRIRTRACQVVLEHLMQKIPREKSRGTDLLATTTMGELLRTVESHTKILQDVHNPRRLMERALLWLHEQEVIRLNHGLTVFRKAMTIRLENLQGRFTSDDFQLLDSYYKGQVLQIHVMQQYALEGLKETNRTVQFAKDYFEMDQKSFLKRWMPQSSHELSRETTSQSWKQIVESLGNPIQRRIVTDDRINRNVLVLAGPGSGKTKVLVHRVAYLIRAKRERPRSILVLTYNRHAAVEIRRRLKRLIGSDSRGILVMTCHAMAMRLTGYSLTNAREEVNESTFDEILRNATDLLNGKGFAPDEANELRDRLLSGFRWILVDEYQDINHLQYELISALAGRTLEDPDAKLTLFAVGDDDQNIYSFGGTSVEFIRRFESDYVAQTEFLTENYRSTQNIIDASNAVIAGARERMKVDHPIEIDRGRRGVHVGGTWETIDGVAKGLVQVFPKMNDLEQAFVTISELQRLARIDPDWQWSDCAVIACEWKYLNAVRAYCEFVGIPTNSASEEAPNFWQLRETSELVSWLRSKQDQLVRFDQIEDQILDDGRNFWKTLIREVLDGLKLEIDSDEVSAIQVIEWLADTRKDIVQKRRGIRLTTAHRAKGLEFKHVVILDGGWNRAKNLDTREELRRLFYVAMTRARETLAISRLEESNMFIEPMLELDGVCVRNTKSIPRLPKEINRIYKQLSLEDVDLGFAGRRRPHDKLHDSIGRLEPRDTLLTIQGEDGRIKFLDQAGNVVGRTSKSYSTHFGLEIKCASVYAVIVRKQEWTDAKYLDSLKTEQWEVVVPEIVFQTI